MQNLTPKQIVDELNRYIIGQDAAKRAVAVAIRNRWRRQQLEESMSKEITPKNIIMMGPTGVGKTEIARRLASLTGAPFIKVEASKFTEVGYHGRDVESMIRDLVEQSMNMVRAEEAQAVQQKAQQRAEDRLVDLLLPRPAGAGDEEAQNAQAGEGAESLGADLVKPEPHERGAQGDREANAAQQRRQKMRQRLKNQLQAGKLDEREVEMEVTRRTSPQTMFANMGMEQMDPEMANLFERLIPENTRKRRMSVAEARRVILEEETERLLDQEKITAEALSRASQNGIVFLDEIDKIASPSEGSSAGGRGPDVSRQGVQRDLLPIVEGSAVQTRHGLINTDHILFLAAGAFHSATVNDLMPELQGRFPIRVELSPLNKEDFVRILTEPGNALTKQQEALLGVEGLGVRFESEAIETIAEMAAQANASLENIGARRLTTVLEKLFETVNFEAPERVAAGNKQLTVNREMVEQTVGPLVQNRDLSKFVL